LTAPWRIDTATGPAAGLLVAPAGPQRCVRTLVPADRAVVLGSTQPEGHIDGVAAARAGIQVVRRRGGGGAVLVVPGQVLWVDVVIPAGDPLWSADVGQAFWWLGDVWVDALAAAGIPGARSWRGGLVRSAWSDRICFAGLGPGEVTVGDAKVVGISQRRTREAAHFQCAVPIGWDPGALLAVMALDDDTRAQAAVDLSRAALGVGHDVAIHVIPAFVDHLP
jgi:lipoate---protein ligase